MGDKVMSYLNAWQEYLQSIGHSLEGLYGQTYHAPMSQQPQDMPIHEQDKERKRKDRERDREDKPPYNPQDVLLPPPSEVGYGYDIISGIQGFLGTGLSFLQALIPLAIVGLILFLAFKVVKRL